jgi:hypothetical protein
MIWCTGGTDELRGVGFLSPPLLLLVVYSTSVSVYKRDSKFTIKNSILCRNLGKKCCVPNARRAVQAVFPEEKVSGT